MTANSQVEFVATNTDHYSVCGGWCLWLACLTIVVVSRQFWSVPRDELQESPAITAKFVVDLNAAQSNELKALPEVGEALASRIVNFRESHGPFTTLDDLTQVPGVGPRTLEQLRPMLSITGELSPLAAPFPEFDQR